MRRILFTILAFSMLLTPWAEAEMPLQSHESILTALREFVESNFRHRDESHEVEVEVAPLDSRLRLAECSQPIQAFYPPGHQDIGHVAVGVRCQGTQPWSIYHKANIRLYKEVTILNQSVRQGAVLTPNDIALVRKDVAHLRGAYLNPQKVINKPLKKSLPAGTVLNADHLTAVKIIKRGQKVLIRAQSANFEVSMSGLALMDGEEGQRIRVRNEESKRVVEGTATAEGIVTITY